MEFEGPVVELAGLCLLLRGHPAEASADIKFAAKGLRYRAGARGGAHRRERVQHTAPAPPLRESDHLSLLERGPGTCAPSLDEVVGLSSSGSTGGRHPAQRPATREHRSSSLMSNRKDRTPAEMGGRQKEQPPDWVLQNHTDTNVRSHPQPMFKRAEGMGPPCTPPPAQSTPGPPAEQGHSCLHHGEEGAPKVNSSQDTHPAGCDALVFFWIRAVVQCPHTSSLSL